MKKRKEVLIITAVIIILIIILCFAFYMMAKDYERKINGGVYVSEIIDGDTFEMSDGRIIRLLCVDTPEEREEGFEEAKGFLEHLVLYKEVRLEKSKQAEENQITDKDKYGRYLRYVYINISRQNKTEEIFVNREIVRLGYGDVFEYGGVGCGGWRR